MSDTGRNVLAIVKQNGQRFVFVYPDGEERQMLQTLREFAADPELDFTIQDAAVLSERVRDRWNASEEAAFFNPGLGIPYQER